MLIILKDGNEIKNPVAQIEIDGETYYYESLARATNDAYNNSTFTVTSDSTETSTLNTTKNLTIQFAESGLGVYSVTGGNFVSADFSTQFIISSNRVLSNSNSLLINVGATATVDGYAVTGTSNGYTFTLQPQTFNLKNISYGGAGSETFGGENIFAVTGDADSILTSSTGNFTFGEKTFGIGGDDSVDFKVNNSVVTGIANFENGTLQADNSTKLSINAEDLTTQFTDTATFIIADSQVISVDGVTSIDGLSNANVHATGNVTVNGASVNVNNLNVTTDNNGEVSNVTNFSGTLQTNSRNVTVNGAGIL